MKLTTEVRLLKRLRISKDTRLLPLDTPMACKNQIFTFYLYRKLYARFVACMIILITRKKVESLEMTSHCVIITRLLHKCSNQTLLHLLQKQFCFYKNFLHVSASKAIIRGSCYKNIQRNAD